MAIQKRPFELSVWIEKLNGSNSKIEEKGVIIGAHDMSYPGRATSITLKREIKGTNTLTFQMPDRYFDSLKGEFVRNEFIDMISPETKLKLFYKDRWFEFFVKKVDEKKQFKSYMKTFTCTDAFIDELSRNGYGIIYDTDLYNNVEEIGTFTENTLEDSIWKYHPENNWGDFTEYKEEKLYRIPVSCFGGVINGYKLNFELENEQRERIETEHGTDLITNPFTKDERVVELSDDLARGCFWDEYKEDSAPVNALTKDFHINIPNDGYIYVPYSCLGFCYGSEEEPDFEGTLDYDRAATETAISINDKLILAPQSVDPRTLIQFYAIPSDAILELDDGGVIMNKDYTFFMTLKDWNESVNWDNDHDWWYMFEDTRLVKGQILGSVDVAQPMISHTFKYLKDATGQDIMGTDWESRGNRCVYYESYLANVNENSIVKGKKFSITDRTEVNVSKDIDQYTKIYNAQADEFIKEYTNEDWDYSEENTTTSNEKYHVCSKLETRQVIPQLARNLVQNGVEMDSIDGWAPMTVNYTSNLTTTKVTQRGVITDSNHESIDSSCLVFKPTVSETAYIYKIVFNDPFHVRDTSGLKAYLSNLKFNPLGESKPASFFNGSQTNIPPGIPHCPNRADFVDTFLRTFVDICSESIEETTQYLGYIYVSGSKVFYKTENDGRTCYYQLCELNDWFYKGLKSKVNITNFNGTGLGYSGQIFTIEKTNEKDIITADYKQTIKYNMRGSTWNVSGAAQQSIIRNFENQDTLYDIDITDSSKSIINFGIIGQDKKIEKDRIYCLGAQIIFKDDVARDSFTISLGKGTMISCNDVTTVTGNYSVLDSTIISIPNLYTRGEGEIVENFYRFADPNYIYDWNNGQVADEQKNIIIQDAPPIRFVLFKTNQDIENPYFVVSCKSEVILLKLYLFEAYTKGMDSFDEKESVYRYSGRDLFWPPKGLSEEDLFDIERDNKTVCQLTPHYEYPVKVTETEPYSKEKDIHCHIIFEDDIMLGSTYGYQHYYIQRLKTKEDEPKFYDTMGKKAFISSDPEQIRENVLPLDAANYTDDDYDIQTNFIDLNRCSYYNQYADIDECDCNYGGAKHTCFYQKFGYCPFRFKTEKHDRRIRTLSINKSNRFNIIQQTSKVFEAYPQFYIEHNPNGSVIKDSDENYLKKVFYITEKGRENKVGFRYEKNLKDISRNIVSDNIVTKLYVLDVDSDLSKTGLCSIKTAEDNPSKDSYIINLDYYVEKGMLDGDEVEQDLYGITPTSKKLKKDEIPSGFLYQLGYYNSQYDELSNKIINLQDASYTELQANLEVNYQGILTSQEQIVKIKKQLDRYKELYENTTTNYKDQQAYQNYLTKLSEQESILAKLIDSTFYTNGVCDINAFNGADCFNGAPGSDTATPMQFFGHIKDLDGTREYWIDLHSYTMGILGQYNKEYLQIQQWKRERASYLKLINQITSAFFKKYEPYLKEGTWSDSNYLTDNAYYFGALDVAADGSIPKVTYNISVIDISPTSEENDEIYDFDLADVTYVEDIGMFGINKHTGLPNKLKVLISGVSEGLDSPDKDTITVQNFTTSFQDLFQQVTASVQSLTYNENIYKRSSNFTSLQNITNDSLQGALDTNELTLLSTDEDNIQVDNTGTRGSDINNHANKYKLDGQGLYFSNDGGQHWSVGVGPSGINADYIRVGTLDAGKIRIADSTYIYFAWDKDGIVAYRDPQSINTNSNNINDAAIFNKFGLSIVENNLIKLRAGYAFNGTTGGQISSESEMADEVGFYLYNNHGEVIFSTTTGSNTTEDERQSAIINLLGQMMVTDTSHGEVSTKFTYSDKYVIVPIKRMREMNNKVREALTAVYPDPDPDNPTAPLVKQCDINGTHYADYGPGVEEAAAHLFSKDSTLTIVNIIKSGTTYRCTNPIVVQHQVTGAPRLFLYTDANAININDELSNDIVEVSLEVDGVSKNVKFYNYADTSKTDIYIYDVNEDKENALYGTHIPTGSETISQDLTSNTVTFYIANGQQLNRDSKPLYNTSAENYYYFKTDSQSSTVTVETSTAMYLNNPAIGGGATGIANGAERLFVCCAQNGSSVNNLFSVLKDGSAYFGGKIDDGSAYPVSTELKDKIKIIDPMMRIAKDGSLYIAFKSIKNNDNDHNGESLVAYIGRAIEENNSSIKTIISDAFGGLEAMIQNVQSQLSGYATSGHTHWIGRHNTYRDGSRSAEIGATTKPTDHSVYFHTERYNAPPGSGADMNYYFTLDELVDTITHILYWGEEYTS